MIFAEWWWPQIPCHLAALQGLLCLPWGANPPFWTLGYEWGLYLIAPAIFGALLVPMLPRRRVLSCAGGGDRVCRADLVESGLADLVCVLDAGRDCVACVQDRSSWDCRWASRDL